MPEDGEVAALVRHIRENLPNLHEAKWPYSLYASLPICVIDAVFSIGVRYESVTRTIKTWCDAQTPPWEVYGVNDEHSIGDFIKIIQNYECDFERVAAKVFQNRQRTSTRSGILKAEAVYLFSKTLKKFDINTLAEAKGLDKNIELRNEIAKIRGLSSGICFDYFLILTGHVNFVKADRMLMRFVANSLNIPIEKATQQKTREAVIAACNFLQAEFPALTAGILDFEIWKFQRRPVTRSSEL